MPFIQTRGIGAIEEMAMEEDWQEVGPPEVAKHFGEMPVGQCITIANLAR